MFRHSYILLGASLISGMAQAYFYELEVWDKKNHQDLYFLSDMHLNVGASAFIVNKDNEQLKIFSKEILPDVVAQCQKSKCKIMVEDSYEFLKQLSSQAAPHFLSSIAQLFRDNKFPVINIETRNKKIVSVNYTLAFEELNFLKLERRALEKKWNKRLDEGEEPFDIARELSFDLQALLDREQYIKKQLELNEKYDFSTHAIIEEIENSINEVKHYNDGPILNNYYQEIIHMMNDYESLFKAMKTFSGTLNEFINKYIDSEYSYIFARGFAVLGWQLLDARVLHEIYNAQEQKIYIFAGGLHIENIVSILPKLGYTKTQESGSKKEAEIFMKDPYLDHLLDIWNKKAASAPEIKKSLIDISRKQGNALDKVKPLDTSELKLLLD